MKPTFLLLALGLTIAASAAMEGEGLRPYVFILARNAEPRNESDLLPMEKVQRIIGAAVKQSPRIANSDRTKLAEWVENVVLLDTTETWVIACYARFNGREIALEEGKLFTILPSTWKTAVVELRKDNLQAQPDDHRSFDAAPFPVFELGGLEPDYVDQSTAERAMRERLREKESSRDDDSSREPDSR